MISSFLKKIISCIADDSETTKLEKYISQQNPKSTADIEFLERKYTRLTHTERNWLWKTF